MHIKPATWTFAVLLSLLLALTRSDPDSESPNRAADVDLDEHCVLQTETMKVIQSETKDALSAQVGKYVNQVALEAAKSRPNQPFTVALSGGSLPKLLAKGLLSYRDALDFTNWHVFFADERYVAPEHEDSNYKACFEAFLKDVSIPTENIYKLNHKVSVEDAAAEYEEVVRKVFKSDAAGPPVFDLVLLGMGPDGHTCSLFPGHPLLDEKQRWVAAISDSPKPPPKRITLTYPVLNSARNVFFLAAGGGKADTMPKVLVKDDELEQQGKRMTGGEWLGLVLLNITGC